jgi:tetratricopeptide (TPR) repeat protein
MTAWEYYDQAVRLLPKKDYDGAIKVFNTALAEYPDSYMNLEWRAHAYHYNKEPEKAIADYTRMIELQPENRNGWNHRGNLYDELGEYDKAIADFTQCIALAKPGYGVYWSNRGISYYHKGDLAAALADLNKSVEVWGDSPSAWALEHRGLVLRRMGELDKALADFTQAASVEPRDEDACYRAGSIWFERQDYDKAIEWYSKAIAAKDDEADSWLARGVCYWNQCLQKGIGFWSEDGAVIDLAEQDFTRAIELAPDMAVAYLDRGMVRGSKAREHRNFIKTLIMDKAADDAERLLLLAQLDHLGGKDFIPQANALLQGLRSNRDEADVLMAGLLGTLGQFNSEEAVEDLDRAIELDPGNAEAYYQRGMAYALTGDTAKALADYEQALSLNPYHKKAAEKRDKLLEA